MSTRCQIEWIGEGKKLLTYRHSDGYPEDKGKDEDGTEWEAGVLKDLREFKKWHTRNNDVEYTPCNWVFWNKFTYLRYLEKEKWCHNPEESIQLGYGFCVPYPKGLHGDIEYFYRVHLNSGEKWRVEIFKPVRVKGKDFFDIRIPQKPFQVVEI